MKHWFEIENAMKYGIKEALMIDHIGYWVNRNKANNVNFFDGYFWTYDTFESFLITFPYLTVKQVRAALENLEVKNVIRKERFKRNKNGGCPNCYTIIDPDIIKQFDLPQRANGDLPKKADQLAQEGKSSITDIKQTDKYIASQSSAQKEPDLFTTKPKKEKPEPKELVRMINGKPDFNESESLHKQIEGFFYHFNKSGYRDFSREGRSINNIIKRAKLYYPEFEERDTLRTIIQKFYELKEQQAKFWKDQPFLPSTLDVKRMWDMLVALIEDPKKEESRLDDIFDRLEKKYQSKRIERGVI